MCCRTASAKPILPRNEMKTAIPPNGVTARCVSRRISRSFDNRAMISRGTGLSVAFDSISLLSQILQPFSHPELRFSGLAYRLRKGSKLLYRDPAYLICTDPELDPRQIIETYFQRWDIEVNFRDEKTLLGVGQAQVRAAASVESA